jgi:hypothetical protein
MDTDGGILMVQMHGTDGTDGTDAGLISFMAVWTLYPNTLIP